MRNAIETSQGQDRRRHSRPTRVCARVGVTVLVVLGATACSLDGLLNSDELPKDVSDPALTETPQGAQSAYHGALVQFREAFGGFPTASRTQGSFVAMTGLLSDELGGSLLSVDQRSLPEGVMAATDPTYSALQKVRGQAGQAIGLVARHLADRPALRGHLYALQAYAHVFLAELFCSGIPLSTVDSGGGFTYRSGATTDQVLEYAVALFDTALTLAGDSARVVDLARVGRARALLGLGRYAGAAATVAGVDDAYRYHVAYNNVATNATTRAQNFARESDAAGKWDFTVTDQEGFNGLNWRTSGDPRTQVTGTSYVEGGQQRIRYRPNKYATDGSTPLVLASGVEARLIEAEAALQADDPTTWLTKLNTLRTNGTFHTEPTDEPNDDPAAVDTIWHAGSGGIDNLAPLADPGATLADPVAAEAVRVDLLFRERAFWLFLTGQRQGDLRRLIRQYGREARELYPVGAFPGSGSITGPYGNAVTAPIPAAEVVNPLFTGCFSRDA